MKLLITTLGIPGAGKSHFAKQLAKKLNAVRLNSDSMRNSVFDNPESTDPDGLTNASGNQIVFGAIDYAATEILKAGYSVVYDAKVNHTTERLKNAGIASRYGAQHVNVWVKVPIEVAQERTETRDITLDQGRLTRKQRIARNSDYLEEPGNNEFTVIVDGTQSFDLQFASFQKQLKSRGE